jgi:hypothetical protein
MTDANVDDNYMLTTTDNPYNPFTQYDEWYAMDATLAHHTPGLLARYVVTSDELSDKDQEIAINQAIDEIVRDNPLGIWKKVSSSDYIPEVLPA